MNQEYITYLKTTYPDIITKDQLYRICHVSKKTASFLLDSGLIPNENSGKKTRKYKIRLDDVIEYLKDREVNPMSYNAPDNYYKGNYSAKKKVAVPSFSEDQVNALRKFLTDQLMECDDVVSIETINELIGYSTKSIYEWYHKGYIKGFLIKKRVMIPKEYLVDFLMSEKCLRISRKSVKHIRLIKSALLSI